MTAQRRSCGVLAAALVVVSACGKKKDEGRTGKLSPPAAAAESALSDTLAAQARALPSAHPSEPLPAWTRELPHFFDRDGRRFASAVGWARSANPGLARSAAEDRARVDLLKLIKGAAPDGALEGALPGAQMTNSFTSKEGQVFARVEVEAPPNR